MGNRTPTSASREQRMHAAIVALVADLDLIGFEDPNAPVNGGDCVDVMCQHYDTLRELIAHDHYEGREGG